MSAGPYYSLAEAARFWPGKPPSIKKLKHAIKIGKPSRRQPGVVIRLEARYDGAHFTVSESAIDEYIERLTVDVVGPSASPRKRPRKTPRTTVSW